MITLIFTMLVMYQVKHFLCDYPLQTPYMLQKFKLKGWVLPLSAHAGTHALGTGVVLLFTTIIFNIVTPLSMIVVCILYDFIIHFVMDRIKAHPSIGGKYKPDNPKYWSWLGGDQLVHHLTHYSIILFFIPQYM